MDLTDLTALARSMGDDSLAPPADPAPARLFSTWEITSHLIPMAPNHLRRSLRAQPDWPQGTEGREAGQMRWFTLGEVQALRGHFARAGRGSRYLPERPAGAPLVVTLMQARPGAGRSTTAAHLAQGAAMAGYRVLVLDLCPSARLSRLLGAGSVPSALPLIAGDAALHLREENRLRLSRGEPVLTPDRDLEAAALPAPVPTGWDGITTLGGGAALAPSDHKIAAWQHLIRSWKPWAALRGGLAAAGHLDPSEGPAMLDPAPRYDLIVIDTGAMLGPLALSALAAADILLMPLDAADPAGGAQTLELMADALAGIEAREGLAARALGEAPPQFRWSALRALLTRFDPARQRRAATRLQAQLGEVLLLPRQDHADVLADPAGPGTIYGIDYRSIGRESFATLRRDADAINREIFDLMAEVWRDRQG